VIGPSPISSCRNASLISELKLDTRCLNIDGTRQVHVVKDNYERGGGTPEAK
jgi:hypothetical protein